MKRADPTAGAGATTLELARASYREIALYAPDRAPCAIDLSDNTNLFGIPPAARRELVEVATATVTRYPPLYAQELKRALARYAKVRESEITTGCGSDDVLDSAIRAFAEPGEKIAFPDPTFAMIPIFARMNGLVPVPVPHREDWDIDAEAMLATRARLFYVCSPNNPTAMTASRGQLERLISQANGVVIIDEAYSEYASDRWIDLAPRHSRLLVVRTLSKAFGLAGLRIGYAAGPETLVSEVEKSRGPYKVNALAERAALAALREDGAWVAQGVATVLENRAKLVTKLKGLGFSPLPSAANFVLFPVVDAARTTKDLRQRGVAVRPFTGLPRINDALRVSIGPWEMMEALLTALKELTR
ncbi:MAG TPA: histidinol-phosphate transaminase [Myxococcaceae bacterium]|nr:histidinol-phosphate transaminase [Myxococcaceae bacterium]